MFHIRMPLNLRLHPQRIELGAVPAYDEVVDTGFVTPVVRLGRVLGVEIAGRPFLKLGVRCEGALVHSEGGVTQNDHFVEPFGGWSPVYAVVVGAVAYVLPVFAIGLVRDKGTSVCAAKAIVNGCSRAILNDSITGFLCEWTYRMLSQLQSLV